MSNSPLGARIAGGVLWTYSAHLGGRIIVFAGLAVAAHVLQPHDFGLFSMAMAVVSFFEVIRDVGLQRALIYFGRSEHLKGVYETGFVLSAALGLVLTVVLLALAPLVGMFFSNDEVVSLVAALSVYFLIAAFGLVPDAVLRQRLEFGLRFWPETGAPLARYLVAIGLAVQGFGAWSLVGGQLAGIVVGVGLTVVVSRWRPRLRFERDTARALMGYGWQMGVVDLASAVSLNLDYILVGRFLGTDALGLYTLAFRLPDTTIVAIAYAVSQILLPAYVLLGARRDKLAAGLLETNRYLGLVLFPASVGIAVLAPVLVPFLFGEKWAASIPVVQFLAVSSLVRGIAFTPGAVFAAAGRPMLSIASELFHAALMVPCLYLAAQIDIVAVGAVQILTGLAYAAFKFSLVSGLLKLEWRDLLQSMLPSAAAAAIMGLTLAAFLQAATGLPSGIVVGAAVPLGMLIYGLGIWLLDSAAIVRARSVAHSVIGQAGTGPQC